MKFLKYGILWLLIGELVVLFTRDDKLRKKLEKTNWRKKCKLVGQELVQLNKDVIAKVTDIDYSEEFEDVLSYVKGLLETKKPSKKTSKKIVKKQQNIH